jgi:hypothetical protein
MNKVFDPQIVFLYNNTGRIYKTKFLFFGTDEELKKKKIFELFTYFKKQYKIFLNDDYEIINDHILLTLSLYEIRGYMQSQILQTDEDILLFSIWDNIDFSNIDGSVFNPFNKNVNYTRNHDQTIIYEIFPRVVNNAIFCVLEERFTENKKMCTSGLKNNKNIIKFIKNMSEVDLEGKDLDIEIIENNKEIFQVDLNDDFEYEILSLYFFKKNINKYFFDNVCITGDDLYYKENNDSILKRKDLSYVSVYENNHKNKVFSVYNNILTIENHILFDQVLLGTSLRKNLLKQKKNKNHTKVSYNLSFVDNVYIDFEINFFLETTKKTKNIFLDRTKKINIMTSSNHILFSSFISNYELYIYITKVIIFIQMQNGFVTFLKQDKKLGNRYFSRYCQGERNPRALNNEQFDISDYVNYNNIFYKHIRNEGDIFYSNDKKDYVVCDTPGLYNIGFIAEIYEGYNICFPCCYKKVKQNTEIFKTCIGEVRNNEEDIFIDPYIHIFKQYRIIMNKNKIGLLIGKLNEIFNSTRFSFLQDRYKIKKVSSKELSKCIRRLDCLNIKQYNNTNIFININNQEPHLFYYTDGSDPNKYSINTEQYFRNNLKKSTISFETKRTTVRFNDIYDTISTLDSFIVINSQNRIELAKKYVVYYINFEQKDFLGIDNIYKSDELILYIIDNSVYFNPVILNEYYRNKENFYINVKFFLIIQNKIHTFKTINKLAYHDDIEIKDLDIKQKRMLIDKIIDLEPIIFEESVNNLTVSFIKANIDSENYFYFDNTSTKYMYLMDNITLNEDTIGYYITDILYKKYFKLFYCNENGILEQKKVFLANLKNFININIEFNKTYKEETDKELILKIKSFLNPLYL